MTALPALALVGCGGMGCRHIRGMKRLQSVGRLSFELAAVCDVLPENSRKAAGIAEELLGRRPTQFQSFTDIIRAERLDAAILTTTPETHAAIGIEALNAGLHLMVEKPIALTVPEGRRLVETAQSVNRKLAVAENYRRDPVNRLAKALIGGGAIGAPFLAVQASSSGGESVVITPWRHRKDRGGILVDMGVHYGDILEYFLGPIATVFGMSALIDAQRIDKDGTRHPADAEDLSVGVARFENGALANWMLNMAGRGEPYFHRAVYGIGGSLVIPSDRSGRPLRLSERRNGRNNELNGADVPALVPDFALDDTTAALFGGDRLASYRLPWGETDANLLGIEQADFVAAIVDDREPEVNGGQGLRGLALALAFPESERVGRPVTLEEVLTGRPAIDETQIQIAPGRERT